MRSLFIILMCLVLSSILSEHVSPHWHVRIPNNLLKQEIDVQIQDKNYPISTRSLMYPKVTSIFVQFFQALLDFFNLLKGPKTKTVLGNRVWNDLNADGIQNAGEPGIPSVTVNLKNSQNQVISTTTTNANGNYLFSGLSPGQYQVVFVKPAGYDYTLPNQGADDAVDSDVVDSNGNTAIIDILSGSGYTTVDAGMFTKASLGGFAWHDVDGDGIQDSGEPGIDGVTVRLKNSQNAIIAITATSGNGHYLFIDLNPGQYQVGFVLPFGYDQFTLSNQGTNDAIDSDVADINSGIGTVTTNLLSGSDIEVDAGMFSKTNLGDFVWNDNNKNGIQDAGEPGISGVTVQLKNSQNEVISTTTTDASGNYLFSGLSPGQYQVVFVKPAGYEFTLPNQGTNDAVDSDVVDSNGNTATINILSQSNNLSLDAGLYSIS